MPTGDGVRFWLEAERELARMPRFVSFDTGVIAGLLSIGVYMAISNRHWIAAAFLFLGVLWMALIPFRLRRVAKSSAPGERRLPRSLTSITSQSDTSKRAHQ